MDQFETQQQILGQKKKRNWKKISVLAGVGAFGITSPTSLITWTVTKEYLHLKNNNSAGINLAELPNLTYQTMTTQEFNQIHEKFYAVKNEFIKKLATEQLMFYLPTADFHEIKTEISYVNQGLNSTFDLTPNLSKLLIEKIINTIGSNLRVWGLNSGYAFNPELIKTNFNLDSWELNEDKAIKFDLDLGYSNTKETFKVKGQLKDSEYQTFPISEFNHDNLERIFVQANNLFKSEINRNGYFVGLNFIGEKYGDKNWKGDQIIKLEEFDTQVWDYVLNSLKNFNLIKENVFVDGIKLFNIDGWNSDKIYVTNKNEVKVNKNKKEVLIGEVNDFGFHSLVSKIDVSYKHDENINFEFWGSNLQNNQWGNY